MSYNEEQTRSYNSMMYAWEVFNEMKQTLKKQKCSIHNKSLKLGASWEREYDVDIQIYKFCCTEFATHIANQFIEKHLFATVIILNE